MKKRIKVASLEELLRFRDIAREKKSTQKVKGISQNAKDNPFLGDFLKRHKLEKTFVFDAKGHQISSIEHEMKSNGAFFAYNTIPCEYGHTYRDRSNHCVICKTSNIAFQLRHSLDGYIYIAGSLERKVIKIGVAIDIKNRENSLNKDAYGSANDWRILFSFYIENSGLLEQQVHKKLEIHKTTLSYRKDNKSKMTNETFFCSFSRAHSTLMEIVKKNNYKIMHEVLKSFYVGLYEFPNRKRI